MEKVSILLILCTLFQLGLVFGGFQPKFQIGIDFGTSKSGYAIRTLGSTTTKVQVNWDSQPEQYCKTDSALLYDQNGTLISWGRKAISTFSNLSQENITSYLLTEFKMRLYHSPHRTFKVQGREFDLVHVIADLLREIMKNAFDEIEKSYGEPPELESIQWTIGVPAIWEDLQNWRMKEAAITAGLIPNHSVGEERFRLVTEPDADFGYFQEVADKSGCQKPKEGDIVLLVDVGGGTTDISLNRVENNGLVQLLPTFGAPTGSTSLDKNFLSLLARKTCAKAMEIFQDLYPKHHYIMLSDWMRRKLEIDNEQRNVRVSVPAALISLNNELCKGILDESIIDGQFVLSPRDIKSIFQPVLDTISKRIHHLHQVADDRGLHIDQIILVGGFAASTLLTERIKKEFSVTQPQPTTVCILDSPGEAVVRGSLEDINTVSRIMRYSIGIAVSESDVSKCPEKYTKSVEGKKMCVNRFRNIVKNGESVPLGKCFQTEILYPRKCSSKYTFITIYKSKGFPRFVNEYQVQELGDLAISHRTCEENGGEREAITAEFCFGGAEMRVSAKTSKGDILQSEFVYDTAL